MDCISARFLDKRERGLSILFGRVEKERERESEVVKHIGFFQQMEILEHEPKLFISEWFAC